MAQADRTGQGTAEDPWVLTTPPGTSQYQLYQDPDADPPAYAWSARPR